MYATLTQFLPYPGTCPVSSFFLNMPRRCPLSSSQANDRHPAVTAHSKQRDHPTKERQRHSALPVWIRIQEGHQHAGQQEVRKRKIILATSKTVRPICLSNSVRYYSVFLSIVLFGLSEPQAVSGRFYMLLTVAFLLQHVSPV